LAAQALAALARTADFRWWGDRLSITVSIGAATVVPAKNQPGEDLIRYADSMLYAAKQAGRDRTAVFSEV